MEALVGPIKRAINQEKCGSNCYYNGMCVINLLQQRERNVHYLGINMEYIFAPLLHSDWLLSTHNCFVVVQIRTATCYNIFLLQHENTLKL
jgi:hypothetical protein